MLGEVFDSQDSQVLVNVLAENMKCYFKCPVTRLHRQVD